MKLLDLTLATPAENLACDEALLDLCEERGEEILRFWESREHFVVVGYGNRVETEVNWPECQRLGVPVLRRCTGGGTVLQGPGCLNYTVTLLAGDILALASVTGTNDFVMTRNRAALERVLNMPVSVQGHTDLAFAAPGSPWLKFSGNAQRRRRRAILFHGTILYGFDLDWIGRLLRFPSAQPEYRASRDHAAFVRNIPADASAIRSALRQEWNAQEQSMAIPAEQINALVLKQYSNDTWNFRR